MRSVAAPVRDATGTVRAAMNVTVHAAETSTETLLHDHLPVLLQTAGRVSADWAMWQRTSAHRAGRVIMVGAETRGPEPTVFERRPPAAAAGRASPRRLRATRCFWLDGLDRSRHIPS